MLVGNLCLSNKGVEMAEKQTVAILGASKREDRYSYKAFSMLKEYGHTPVPIHPLLKELEGVPVYASLDDINVPIDTLTVYIGIGNIQSQIPRIVALKPKRVILNPGTESPELKEALDAAGIPYLESCTLVMLRTGVF